MRLLLAILLAIDCAGNVLIGGSFDHTLSATAWEVKRDGQPYWSWLNGFINWLARNPNHCRWQFEAEQKYGSAWAALRASNGS